MTFLVIITIATLSAFAFAVDLSLVNSAIKMFTFSSGCHHHLDVPPGAVHFSPRPPLVTPLHNPKVIPITI